MSEMCTDVVYRARLSGEWTKETAMEFCNNFMEPAFEGEFCYDVNNEGFTFSLFADRLYLDYFVSSEYEQSDFEIDITQEFLNEMAEKIIHKFSSLVPFIESTKLKILQYYNGGCAGVSEVE